VATAETAPVRRLVISSASTMPINSPVLSL
jgi:hypothetical protein